MFAKLAVLRIALRVSIGLNPGPHANVVRCCKSTSSGLNGGFLISIKPLSKPRRRALSSSSSNAFVGINRTFDVPPGQ